MKLISMTDFVLEQRNDPMQTFREAFHKMEKYANFLKQPLTLGMFVPCDLEGNILEEPKCEYSNIEIKCDCNADKGHKCIAADYEYERAKERILFKNVELISNLENAFVFKINDFEFCFADTKPSPMILVKNRSMCTIEQLTNYIYDYSFEVQLTESAIK